MVYENKMSIRYKISLIFSLFLKTSLIKEYELFICALKYQIMIKDVKFFKRFFEQYFIKYCFS